MNVWGLSKKILGIGLIAVPLTFTGCLTEEDDPAPVNTGVALSAEKKDTVWNLQGLKRGAYNLVTGVTVASTGSATDKDVLDMAVVGGAGVNWPKTLTSGNGTMFVKAAASFDFAAATDSSTVKAYNAGTGSAVTPVLANNDVIIAKLRGGTRYAAVKIISVTETASDNLDYFYFGYRLTP